MPLPVPTPDETHERFAIRTHRALMSSVPDPDQRNEIVESQWRRHRGNSLEDELVARAFPSDKFVPNQGVCVFAEHDAVDGNGEERHYGLAELCRIIRCNNERIRDRGIFCPITDGHTPDPDEDREDPDVFGYAGKYRLGMVGREKPAWAIFTDEHHYSDQASRVRRKPGRSVELWTYRNNPRQSHFYPIAALGGDAPRLPLPQKFSNRRFRLERRDGVLVERYTFSAPSVSPGGGNSFLKKFDRGEKMLSQEDIGQLLAALQETPQFKFISELMAKESGSPEGGQAPEGAEYQDEGNPPLPAMGEGGGEDDDLADLNDLIVQDDEEEGAPPVKMGMGAGKYSQRAGQRIAAGKAAIDAEATVQKYRQLQASHNRLVSEYGRVAKRVDGLLRTNADAERTQAVYELARKYPDFVDPDQELDLVLYSRNSKLGDDAFAAHMATVEKYAQRAEMTSRSNMRDLPMGEVDRGPRNQRDVERYEAKIANEAVKIHTQWVNAGKPSNYEMAREEAEKRLSQAG